MTEIPEIIEIPTPEVLPATFAQAEAVLATTLPGYQPRAGQQLLASRIEDFITEQTDARREALNNDGDYRPGTLLGQAPCGIGKSLGYLIPAILSHKRVVVSVTTKALQSQLVVKDVPFLEEHLPAYFSWAELRGRANYYCSNVADASKDPGSLESLPRIRAYAEQTPEWNGLRESLPFEVADREWTQIHAESEACRDCNCSKDPIGEEGCYATKARRHAAEVDLVIVNHALLGTELVLSEIGIPSMLDTVDLVICDEAHEFADSISNVIGFDLKPGTFSSLIDGVAAFAGGVAEDAGNINADCADVQFAADDLFAAIAELEVEVFRGKAEPISRRPAGATLRLTDDLLVDTSAPFIALMDALGRLTTAWDSLDFSYSDHRERLRKQRLDSQLRNTLNKLRRVVGSSQLDLVRWLEVEVWRSEKRLVLKTSPVSVAEFLDAFLWSQLPTVLVSATLVVKSSFDYLKEQLGITRATTLAVDSPFDFSTQATLYVPQHLAIPQGQDTTAFEAGATEEIYELIKTSKGRALVLFTSKKRMLACAESIRSRRGFPYQLLVQGEAPVAALAAEFKADVSSVLFGLKSFMTGFDAPGDALSLLVIDKLPFPVPGEPITEAKCQRIEAKGGKSFPDYTMPFMSLIIQQAAGRLIRHTEDIGVVAILDRRITEKYYGKQILRDLPPFPLTKDFATVEQFFANH